jgi:hypothetical protein
MSTRRFRLPRPQLEAERAEAPAVIEPPLRDIPEYDGMYVEGGFQPFQSESFRVPVDDELARRVREVTLADERVQRVLGDSRHVVVGVSRRVDDKDRRTTATLLVAYRYDDERAVEVWLGGEEGDVQVAEVIEADYQPAPGDEETARAIELARGDRRLGRDIADDFEATVILTSDVAPGDRHYGRRRFIVGFGPADERQPRVRALVDLGADEVLAVEMSDALPIGKVVEE